MNPDIKSSFVYDGQIYQVEWYTVTHKNEIPNLDWKQIYAVGDLNGLVPLVTNATSSKQYNLPGGSTEPGETLEQTLKREILEECNMEVLSWEPLGYQIITEPSGEIVPQFRAYAKLRKIGEFTNDPGGNVIANTLFHIDQVNEKIGYGDVGERLVGLARPHFTE